MLFPGVAAGGYGPVRSSADDFRASPYTAVAGVVVPGSAGGALVGYQQLVQGLQSTSPDGREVCQFFQKSGWCKFADACRFAHIEGAAVIREKQICQFFAKAGWCKWAEQCRYLHEGAAAAAGAPLLQPLDQLSQLQPLQGALGVQSYPTATSYSSVGQVADSAPFVGPDGSPAICKFYNAPGGCRSGESCRYLHTGDPGPSEGCNFFQRTGWCKFGDACKFVHSYDAEAAAAAAATAPWGAVAPAHAPTPQWREARPAAAGANGSVESLTGKKSLGGDGSVLAAALAKFAEAVASVKKR